MTYYSILQYTIMLQSSENPATDMSKSCLSTEKKPRYCSNQALICREPSLPDEQLVTRT